MSFPPYELDEDQCRQIADAIGQWTRTVRQSDQYVEEATVSSDEISQMRDVISQSFDQWMRGVRRSDHNFEEMMVSSDEVSQMTEAITNSSNQMLENLATAESLDSVFTNFRPPHYDYQQPEIHDEDLPSEITRFQVQSLTEYIYNTLINEGITLTKTDII